MSDKLPQQPTSEEVDLGKLFSVIEKFFKKIGELILRLLKLLGWLLTKLGIFLLLALNIIKTQYIKIGLAGLLTFGAFYLLDKTSPPVYQSNIIIKQNYPTGKILYNNIETLNQLAIRGDSLGLAKQLGIPVENSAQLLRFQVVDFMNQNTLRKYYYDYIKDVDSTMIISFHDYSINYDLENYPFQSILINAKTPDAFNGLSQAIINSFETNSFFVEEKEKTIALINNQIQTRKDILINSNNLQEQYIKLLEKYYGAEEDPLDPNNMTINLNMSNNKDKITTREYDLFEEQSDIKLELVSLENQLKELEFIVRLQKDFSPPFIVTSFYRQNRVIATLLAMGIVILFYIIKEFRVLELIDKYGKKEKFIV